MSCSRSQTKVTRWLEFKARCKRLQSGLPPHCTLKALRTLHGFGCLVELHKAIVLSFKRDVLK